MQEPHRLILHLSEVRECILTFQSVYNYNIRQASDLNEDTEL